MNSISPDYQGVSSEIVDESSSHRQEPESVTARSNKFALTARRIISLSGATASVAAYLGLVKIGYDIIDAPIYPDESGLVSALRGLPLAFVLSSPFLLMKIPDTFNSRSEKKLN